MESIIVTGATSMLGIALIGQALLEKEIKKIYAVVREDSKKTDRIPLDERITIIPCDINNYGDLKSRIKAKADVFYHFAWNLTGRLRNTDILEQTRNIGYALDAVHAGAELGCKKFVGAGTQAEYGDIDVIRMSPDTAVNPAEPYGITKFCAGKLVRQEAAKLQMDCFWVRIFSVYGEYDSPDTMVASAVRKLLQGQSPVFTPAENMWDFLESSDAGRAFLRIGQKAAGNKVYCLGSGKGRSLKEYIEIIGKVVNPDVELRIGELPYPNGKCRGICANISAITMDTGWIPEIGFEEGIQKMCGKI